jgi:anti-sigma regulatory factor (Ser/Thr protein kinase)
VTTLPGAGAHRPAPLRIELPAVPASLAVVRERLRNWLPTASVNPSAAAAVVLAVGEAASNAVEHAVRGAGRDVVLQVSARATATGLALTVKDNGRWQAQPPSAEGRRGFGSKLMQALVDTVTITPTPHGTKVEMRKELQP